MSVVNLIKAFDSQIYFKRKKGAIPNVCLYNVMYRKMTISHPDSGWSLFESGWGVIYAYKLTQAHIDPGKIRKRRDLSGINQISLSIQVA